MIGAAEHKEHWLVRLSQQIVSWAKADAALFEQARMDGTKVTNYKFLIADMLMVWTEKITCETMNFIN